MKKLAVGAIASAVVMTGTSAYAFGSKSTQLSNGVLSVAADDGCQVSGNCSLFYSATTYKKTGGSKVTVRLALDTSNELFKDSAKSVSKGQTVKHNWGGLRKSRVQDCSVVGYMEADTGQYYTPPVSVC
ncbi:hypothetical protein [Streptomyces sp. Tu102]|uniref:hypothetical protein n=1 Tax=Streptomyces TaxID=1883 RepID=UPI001BDDC666|nr:hypothetical protein [Streptomyces sp. Tu102]MBT1095083.1 hypothetical protein [Streptomyces sp. Tu102]